MVKKKTPEKLSNVLEKIKECIDQERYIFSKHSLDRVRERNIDIPTTINVLLTGYEEKKKTCFDKEKNSWKYAIRGKTDDELNVRIIVSFNEDGMVVITVMHILEGVL